MAFSDDKHAVCAPARVAAMFAIVEQEMQTRAHIRTHHGKTQLWNREREGRLVTPEAVVW